MVTKCFFFMFKVNNLLLVFWSYSHFHLQYLYPIIRGEFNSPSANFGNVHPSDVLDMPVDPNEPTYCLCHQVSYGEMIGCDNTDVSFVLRPPFSLSASGIVISPHLFTYLCYQLHL